jgi:curved DNA-binding protein CbpA
VTDYFALLNEPRRPWLDPDALKQKFLALSANLHPDRIHSASGADKDAATKTFTELNAAFNCLAEPKLRLLHLLELELGAKPKDIQEIPTALADLFAEIANGCRNADVFLVEKNQAISPLVQVQLFERGQDWLEKLNGLQRKLNEFREELNVELKSLDEKWVRQEVNSRRGILPGLEILYRLYSYFNRWNGQIQERVVQLSI